MSKQRAQTNQELYGIVLDAAVFDYVRRVVTGDRDSIRGILKTGIITPDEELEYFGDLLLAEQVLKIMEGATGA